MERLFYEYNFEQQHVLFDKDDAEPYAMKPSAPTSSMSDFAAPLIAPLEIVDPNEELCNHCPQHSTGNDQLEILSDSAVDTQY